MSSTHASPRLERVLNPIIKEVEKALKATTLSAEKQQEILTQLEADIKAALERDKTPHVNINKLLPKDLEENSLRFLRLLDTQLAPQVPTPPER